MSAWQAVFRQSTGELVSIGTVVANPMPPDLAAVGVTEDSIRAAAWSPASRRFDAPIPKAAIVRTRDFMRLFTSEERAKVERLRRTDDDVASFMSLLLADPTVNRADPDVGQGLSLLIARGVLANQARADAIRNG